MTPPLQETSDRAEIEQLLVRYCHAIDQRDWDTYRSVYTDDAVIDDIGAGLGRTVDEMVEFLDQALQHVVQIQHAISTSLVEIDGHTARAHIVCHSPVVIDLGDDQTRVRFQAVCYADELKRTTDGWRITKRAEQSWFDNLPPSPATPRSRSLGEAQEEPSCPGATGGPPR